MKILLLGSEGMLGSELFAVLKLCHEVVGKDIQDFDIASADDCRRLVADIRPDVVINAVAYTDVDGCEANQDKCFAVNAEGVKMWPWHVRKGISRLFISARIMSLQATETRLIVRMTHANP